MNKRIKYNLIIPVLIVIMLILLIIASLTANYELMIISFMSIVFYLIDGYLLHETEILFSEIKVSNQLLQRLNQYYSSKEK